MKKTIKWFDKIENLIDNKEEKNKCKNGGKLRRRK